MLYRRTIKARTDELAATREELGDALREAGIGHELIQDVLLVGGELTANAVEHGCGQPVTIEVTTDPGLRVSVTVLQDCDGRGLPEVEDWVPPADPLVRRGRGLAIVAAVSASVAVEANHTSTIVRAWLGPDPVSF